MKQSELDKAVAQILSDTPDEEVVRDSARRLYSNIFDSAFIATDKVEKITGCRDVQRLIPGYRNGSLSEARTLLVKDHLLECAECRRVMNPRALPAAKPVKQLVLSHAWSWALASALVVGIGIALVGANRGILPWQHKLEATVESIQGSVYRVTGAEASIIKVGALLRNADELRTAKDARAVLRLTDGARLELAERSEVSMASAWHGTDVNLQRGRMIVQSDDAPLHKVFIFSGDMVISANAGVIAVDHGAEGSRVAVAKGSFQLQRGRMTDALFAGQQFSTNYAVYHVPAATEFAWSQNADEYAALLNQLSTLQTNLQAIPTPGLRYKSTLAAQLPADTVFYAAIPNLGATLTQAKQMFDAQLAQSDVLRNWWQQQGIAKSGKLDDLLNQVSAVSSYLGDEVVVAMTSDGVSHNGGPVLLAQIIKPGLADYLKANVPLSAGLTIETDNNLLVVSSSLPMAQEVKGGFAGTPLYSRIQEIYNHGAGYFVAVSLEQIAAESVNKAKDVMPPGLDKVQFLVLERKEISGATQMRATLSFDGGREGFASWLAAPGPAGSLDFVSSDASLVTSIVMKNPSSIVRELIDYGTNANPGFAQSLADFEQHAGVNLMDDVAAPLGSDITFAVDGPGLPTSAWKVAIEVYDSARLQNTLAMLVDRFNQQAPATKIGTLQLSSHQAGGQVVYAISSSKTPTLGLSYIFVDGYLLAGPDEANLLASIQNKRSGLTLANSTNFRSKVPPDGYTNFSGMIYQNLGNTLGPLAEEMKKANALPPAQRRSLSMLSSSTGPGLICLYGDRDRITASSMGSFLGFDLASLAGVYQGKPVLKLASASLLRNAAN